MGRKIELKMDNDIYKGIVILEKLSYDDKLDLMGQVDFEELQKLSEGSSAISKSAADNLRKMYSFVEQKVVKIELVNKQSDEKVNTIDDLKYEDNAMIVMSELSTALISGGLGNDKKKPSASK